MPSSVLAIYIAPSPGTSMQSVERVEARAGLGLVGDRYHAQAGTFSSKPPPPGKAPKPRDVTLIEVEAIEAATRDYGVALEPAETRRNILVRGAALNHLVGREFRVGQARLRGVELCEPCGHLEKLTRTGVRAALVHRGGLRCAVVADGGIAVGDGLVAEE